MSGGSRPNGKPGRVARPSRDALARYRQKRDFSVSPEPRGMRHFYIQRHAARRLHYDFRLELDGVLRSWAVPKGPSLDPAQRRLAVEVEDHPLEYGDFEGTIPEKHYGAGEVILWDRGTWATDEADPATALARGKLKFHLDGHKMHGAWTLVRMHEKDDNAAAHGRPNWLLIKEHDAVACQGEAAEITRLLPGSVKHRPPPAPSSASSPLPDFVEPQLATLVATPPRGTGWIYEAKYDGYRLLARVRGDELRLFTRHGVDWSERLPRLRQALAARKLGDSWLDGEIVVLDKTGRPDFQALQNAFDAGRDAAIVYYVFDAPWLAGHDLRRASLLERKARLAEALGAPAGDNIGYSDHFSGAPGEVAGALEQACRLGLEGLIGKQGGDPYVGGRGRSWIKLKCRQGQEFVIGGYTDPGGTRRGLGALLLGQYDSAGALRYAGRVGTGFDAAQLDRLASRLRALEGDTMPFADAPAMPRTPRIHWVRPELVAEIDFAGWTEASLVRQASFVGLREDKPAASVQKEIPLPTMETKAAKAVRATAAATPPAQARRKDAAASAQVVGVGISHPGRPIWPGISKLDLARYHERVAAWLLPHLRGRPLSLLRCPDGIEGECFFQRHMEPRPPGVGSFTWKEASKSEGDYLYANSLEAVIGLVQRGVVEFHTWGATLPRAERPDRLILDLDPAPELPWAQVVEGARLTRTLLDELGLPVFLKTTGGKGLHLVVPLKRSQSWAELKKFAARLAEHLARVVPERFTASPAKAKRSGRIFVDYLRNDPGATAVAAYSTRARPGAPVSTPLDWDELSAVRQATDFNLNSIPARLAALGKDPWVDYDARRQALTRAMWARLDAA